MPPPSYELDTFAANLIERMEGSRRTWLDQPEQARDGFHRIAVESLDLARAEYERLMGADGWPEILQREILETFLPRYTRLAIQHNALEAKGYGAWRGGDPVGRIVATGLAILGALAVEQVFRHPATLVLLLAALFVPVMPELRAAYARRQYAHHLQETVDDLERIQKELDRYAANDDQYLDARLEEARKTVSAAAATKHIEKG